MRDSAVGLVIIILLGAVAVYYAFTAINVALCTKSKKTKRIFYVIYALMLVTLLALVPNLKALEASLSQVGYTFVIAYVMGFSVFHLLLLAFMLIDDARRLIQLLAGKFRKNAKNTDPDLAAVHQNIPRSQFIARLGLISGIVIFSNFFIGIKNKYNYKIRRVKLKLDKTNAALKGLKIIQISDIHTGSFDNEDAVQRGIDMINSENPDFVLFTGDIVNHKSDELVPYKHLLAGINAKVYSVLGNHDYGDYYRWDTPEDKVANFDLLLDLEKEMGWELLRNEHRVIERNGEKFAIIGVENWGHVMRFPRYGDMDKAYAGLENTDMPKILMTHDPSHWDAQIRPNFPDVDLTLSGHTHGMQFGIDLSWFRWSPSRFVYKQWADLYQEGKQFLYVNRGYGFLGYRGRVGILPEITVLEFE